jgi:lysophospholipase L1-like esterase
LLIVVLEVRLRSLADERAVLGIDWQIEDVRINEMNAQKISQEGTDRRWHSAGMPWPEKSAQRKRILVVGDSFAWGSGNLNANEIWWRQLARELQHRGYWNVDVVALCAQGASTEDQLEWLRGQKWLGQVEPDLVIFGYVTNDPAIRSPGAGFLVKQIGGDVPLPDWQSLDRSLGVVAPNLNVQVKRLLTRKWQSRIKDAYEYGEWELRILEEPNISRYRAVLEELSRFLAESRVPHFFVSLPNAPTPDVFEPRYSKVEPLFRDAGLSFHNLLGDFVGENRGGQSELDWGVNPANGHPGPASTRFYALKVADLLEQQYSSSLGLSVSSPASLRPRINDWMPPSTNVREVRRGVWEMSLPAKDALAPRLPLRRAHAVLSFEHPVAMSLVRISSADGDGIELFATILDPKTRIEHKELLRLGSKRGSSAEWSIPPDQLVHTLRVAGDPEASEERRIRLEVELAPSAVQP